MAYVELTVLAADKAGDETLALESAVDTQGTDGFEFVNDGQTIVKVIDDSAAGDGDTITLEAVLDRYGRAEDTLTRTIVAKKSYIYGPFLPEIWNQGGKLRFKFTGSPDANTTVMAVRVANPT